MQDFIDTFFTDQPLEKDAERRARLLAQRALTPPEAEDVRWFCFGWEPVIEYMLAPLPLDWGDKIAGLPHCEGVPSG